MLGNPRLRSLATAQAARHGHAYGSVYTLVLGNKILGNIRAVAFDDAGYEAAERGWLKDTDFGKKAAIVGPTTVTGVRITHDGRPSFTRLPKSDEDAAKAVAGRVKNPKGAKKNPTIREAQAAEQILGSDFGFVRYLGHRIESFMPKKDQRWVIDQMMATEIPQAMEMLQRAMQGALSTEPRAPRPSRGMARSMASAD